MSYRLTLASLLLASLGASVALARDAMVPAATSNTEQAAIQEAASWVGRENKVQSEYRYVMTCRVHLIFFWAGSDDVGGGYVRIGKASGDDRQEMIQVLFGSDPSKAPLSINRWGSGTEVLRGADSSEAEASAFFGFMKSSKGQSVMAMRSELSKEKATGSHLFEGIISRVDDGQALSATVPYTSSQDFDLHQYAQAEKATLQQLHDNPARQIHSLQGAARQACPREGEFLSTILQLTSDATAGHSTPESLCYLYNARHYVATLMSVQPVAEKTVHIALRGSGSPINRTYRHLKQARFEVVEKETGGKSNFDILLGTDGNQRGTPLQITYQPNWWFQVVLNLMPDTSTPVYSSSRH
jgi:hypothetical protein